MFIRVSPKCFDTCLWEKLRSQKHYSSKSLHSFPFLSRIKFPTHPKTTPTIFPRTRDFQILTRFIQARVDDIYYSITLSWLSTITPSISPCTVFRIDPGKEQIITKNLSCHNQILERYSVAYNEEIKQFKNESWWLCLYRLNVDVASIYL